MRITAVFGPVRVARVLTVLTLAVAVPGSWLFGPTVPAPARAPWPETAQWLREPGGPPDPATATPAQVAAFLAGPSAAGLAARYPRLVGALDGAPAALRYAANARLNPAGADRRMLLWDTRGDGRAAEVIGDLATADRVAVLVPGVDSTLANFDTGHGDRLRRAPSFQARQLAAAARAADPAARVAVIAWLGYDPPEGVRRDALREDRAAAGARDLERLLAGLTLGRPHRTVTVIGHSYGSLVAGLARLGPQVTDLVALGSPGMGGAGSVAELPTTARVWAGSSPRDWTRRLPGLQLFGVGHGRLPVDPAFGALPLPAADVEDHDGYFLPGCTALRAMALIVTGQTAAVNAGR